jgi:Domain of unknown function (DUF4091)
MAHFITCLGIVALVAAAPFGSSGETIKLPVNRDVWFSNVGPEADGNNGGAPQLKLKSYQEISLIDVDPAPLKGRVVAAATLHLRLSAEPILRRVTVGTFAAPWVEGTGRSYAVQTGSSTFRHARHPDVAWTPDGGDLCRVMLGQGGTLWKMADAAPPDKNRWQTIAVEPSIVAARVAGISHGFLLFDDSGSEWTREGEKFTTQHMPNRFVYSRDQNAASAPYFTVSLGPVDRAPPHAPEGVRTDIEGLPAGEARLSWLTPKDEGPAGTLGFVVTVDGNETARASVPSARKTGERVVMHLRDLGLAPGASAAVSIRAVDGAGNLGPAATTGVRVSSVQAAPLPGANPSPLSGRDADFPLLGGARIAVIDELDKVQPVTGRMIPEPAAGYVAANHLWSARDRRIRLHAARNEFIGFQVLIQGRDAVRPTLTFNGPVGARVRAAFGRYALLDSKLGPLPDPITPLDGLEERGVGHEEATSQSLHVEIYVPHDVPAGDLNGALTLTSGGETLELAVSLRVWDFTLPDALSFLPEMNCYGLPANERDFYRLAHRHRTVLNRVPYSQRGEVADGCAPVWDAKSQSFDWSNWDRRFGPLFDGSAFADLPRKNMPIELFYLPLHENWPTQIDPNYNGDYWADRAFTPAYRAAFVAASRQFAAHLDTKGWGDTLFECFFNGKLDFKRNGWSRGSSPWLLDEPANFQDFWALRYFGAAFHEGVKQAAPKKAKAVFRADISRPEWQRDALDGLLDCNIVGGAFRNYRRIVLDRKDAEQQVVIEYGSANAVEESNVQPLAWSLDAWTLGVDGVLPWQTIGRAESWQTADTLALFYPGRHGKEPVPSIRLKAFRRGQQDVEYLTLLARSTHEPRWAVAQRVREQLKLSGARGSSGLAAVEDAGTIRYGNLRPQDIWTLRVRVGEVLSAQHPAPARRLVEFKTPPRDPSRLEPKYVGANP